VAGVGEDGGDGLGGAGGDGGEQGDLVYVALTPALHRTSMRASATDWAARSPPGFRALSFSLGNRMMQIIIRALGAEAVHVGGCA
jgi:hypothetical protein